MENYYDLLKIERTASDAEIKRAYRKLALKVHPDQNPNNTVQANRMFVELTRAYETLINPKQRAEYDELFQEPKPKTMPEPEAPSTSWSKGAVVVFVVLGIPTLALFVVTPVTIAFVVVVILWRVVSAVF